MHYPGIRPTNRPFPRRASSRLPSRFLFSSSALPSSFHSFCLFFLSCSFPRLPSTRRTACHALAEGISRVHNSRRPINYPSPNCRNNYERASRAIKCNRSYGFSFSPQSARARFMLFDERELLNSGAGRAPWDFYFFSFVFKSPCYRIEDSISHGSEHLRSSTYANRYVIRHIAVFKN